MIQALVDAFMARREELRASFAAKHPADYGEIVKAVVRIYPGAGEHDRPDPERIHVIDDGDYQGTLLYVIASGGYQPDEYWYVKVGYGSCSGCDTLQGIRDFTHGPPSAEQVEEYLTLALHIVQGFKKMGDEE